MKFIFATLAALAVSTLANPIAVTRENAVQERQFESQGSVLDTLLQTILVHTAAINQTLAGVPASPDNATAQAAVDQVGPELQAITAALLSANSSIAAIPPPDGTTTTTKRQLDGAALAAQIIAIVNELISTVKTLITTLGLAPLLGYLNPLLLGLSGLVLSLDALVTGLLLTVTALVSSLLAGLGVALGSLGFPA